MSNKLFNTHFTEANHNGENYWEARLIDKINNAEELRSKKNFGFTRWMLFSLTD